MPAAPPRRILTLGGIADPVLAHLAPLGLAASAGTALLVDLDPGSSPYPSARTVAALLEDGPTAGDLVPGRRGVAVLASGGAGPEDGWPLVERLARGWDRMVVRLPSGAPRGAGGSVGHVPVFTLFPGPLAPSIVRPAVYQSLVPGTRRPAPGTVLLPPIRPSAIVRMLQGMVEPASRWVRAWTPAWSLRWP